MGALCRLTLKLLNGDRDICRKVETGGDTHDWPYSNSLELGGSCNSYFHHEGVIELFLSEAFSVFLSQRAQPEGSNKPKNPRTEMLNRPSGELSF